ncbi:hypothetical protein HanOQP8_Chr09g0320601 [Helianthus annuus]|nr:hypothetical protein HanOQP8_Chr09g0320601 [Helianthus annuus]
MDVSSKEKMKVKSAPKILNTFSSFYGLYLIALDFDALGMQLLYSWIKICIYRVCLLNILTNLYNFIFIF